MDLNQQAFFSILDSYFNAQDAGLEYHLTVDELIHYLNHCTHDDIDDLLERFGRFSEEKRVRAKSLLLSVSDKIPFQIQFDGAESLETCTVSQFALPIIVETEDMEEISIDPVIPPIILTRICDQIAEMIEIDPGDRIMINPTILHEDQIHVGVLDKFKAPMRLINEGQVEEITSQPMTLTPKDHSLVVYLYCLAVRFDDEGFQGYRADKLFFETERILSAREKITESLNLWFANREYAAEAHCGIPGTLPICFETAKATQREITFSSYFAKSPIRHSSDIIAVINHNESEGLVVRLFSNNQCVLAFSYGRPLVYDRSENYLDEKLLESRIKGCITQRVFLSNDTVNVRNISELIDKPLIHSEC